eukprot:4479254-Amphidinium_carterae.1
MSKGSRVQVVTHVLMENPIENRQALLAAPDSDGEWQLDEEVNCVWGQRSYKHIRRFKQW